MERCASALSCQTPARRDNRRTKTVKPGCPREKVHAFVKTAIRPGTLKPTAAVIGFEWLQRPEKVHASILAHRIASLSNPWGNRNFGPKRTQNIQPTNRLWSSTRFVIACIDNISPILSESKPRRPHGLAARLYGLTASSQVRDAGRASAQIHACRQTTAWR
jgi:hypothetical protein